MPGVDQDKGLVCFTPGFDDSELRLVRLRAPVCRGEGNDLDTLVFLLVLVLDAVHQRPVVLRSTASVNHRHDMQADPKHRPGIRFPNGNNRGEILRVDSAFHGVFCNCPATETHYEYD